MISRSLRLAAKVAITSAAAVTATAWMPIRGIKIWLRIDPRIGELFGLQRNGTAFGCRRTEAPNLQTAEGVRENENVRVKFKILVGFAANSLIPFVVHIQ